MTAMPRSIDLKPPMTFAHWKFKWFQGIWKTCFDDPSLFLSLKFEVQASSFWRFNAAAAWSSIKMASSSLSATWSRSRQLQIQPDKMPIPKRIPVPADSEMRRDVKDFLLVKLLTMPAPNCNIPKACLLRLAQNSISCKEGGVGWGSGDVETKVCLWVLVVAILAAGVSFSESTYFHLD